MKKFFVLPLLLVIFCGCSQPKQISPILNDISFEAQISYENENFVCDTTLLDDTLNFSVIKPDEIKGSSLTLSENSVKAEFNGLSFEPDINSIPQGAVIKVFLEVLKDVKDKKIDCNDNNCIINGSVSEYEYKFVFAPTGLPISLTIDELDLEIDFKNVTVN